MLGNKNHKGVHTMEYRRNQAGPTGYCWCGCGEETDKYFVQGHDRKAQSYLVDYFLEFLQIKHTDNPTADLIHALGFDPKANRLKETLSRVNT